MGFYSREIVYNRGCVTHGNSALAKPERVFPVIAAPVPEALNGRVPAWEQAMGDKWQGFPNIQHERLRAHPAVLTGVGACRGYSPATGE
jgi:hypothetical protein